MNNLIFKKIKKFFLEPKIPIGIFLAFMVFLGVVVWYGTLKGMDIQSLNLFEHHYIGDVVSTPDISLQIESVRRDPVGAGPLVPQQNHEFVVATVTLQNNTDKPFDMIPLLFFYVKDSAGNVYNVVSVPSNLNQLSGPILPHDKIREEIGFDVSKNALGLKLYFEPGLPNNSVVSVDLVGQKL